MAARPHSADRASAGRPQLVAAAGHLSRPLAPLSLRTHALFSPRRRPAGQRPGPLCGHSRVAKVRVGWGWRWRRNGRRSWGTAPVSPTRCALRPPHTEGGGCEYRRWVTHGPRRWVWTMWAVAHYLKEDASNAEDAGVGSQTRGSAG